MDNTFEVTSGKLVVSDPSYKLGTWCQCTLDDVKNGTWEMEIKHERNAESGPISKLIAHHEDHHCRFVGEWINGNICVDSGQLGVFDYDHYKNDSSLKDLPEPSFMYDYEGTELFYRHCCDITLSKIGAGVIPHGCVSSSGYGDGSYVGEVFRDRDGKIVGVVVTFIDDDNCDEEDY